MDREAWRAAVHGGHKELDTTERIKRSESPHIQNKDESQNYYAELKKEARPKIMHRSESPHIQNKDESQNYYAELKKEARPKINAY